jgi:hypothetical protein
LEAASLPAATSPLESVETRAYADAADLAAFANRLALGLAAGLIAVLIHGEAGRLSSPDLTWRALLGS